MTYFQNSILRYPEMDLACLTWIEKMETFCKTVDSSFWSSPVIIILVTFLLTSVLGAYIAAKFQYRNWKHQKETSDQDEERNVAENIFSEVTKLMDMRLYRKRQLLWSLNRNDSKRVEDKMIEYKDIVYKWNDSNNINLSKIELYFGNDERNFFEKEISRGFIDIGVLLERWYLGREDHPPYNELFSMIDSLNALVYDFDKRLLGAIQTGKVGRFRK